MRPGQIRPGNNEQLAVLRARYEASMRPGQIRPGNRTLRPGPERSNACFNEAGANSPRKYRQEAIISSRLTTLQ